MTPFEVVFGQAPPILLDYLGNTSIVEAVNGLLTDRSQAPNTLKENLLRAQL